MGITVDWGAAPPQIAGGDACWPSPEKGSPGAALIVSARGGLALRCSQGALLWCRGEDCGGSGGVRKEAPGDAGSGAFTRVPVAENGAVALPAWAASARSFTAWVRVAASGGDDCSAPSPAAAAGASPATPALDAELRVPLGPFLELRPRALLPTPVCAAFSARGSAVPVGPGRALLSLRLRSLFDGPVRLLSASLAHLPAAASSRPAHPSNAALSIPPRGEAGLLFEVSFPEPAPPPSILDTLTSALPSSPGAGGGGGADGAFGGAGGADEGATGGWAIRRPAGPLRAPHLAAQGDSPRARGGAGSTALASSTSGAIDGGPSQQAQQGGGGRGSAGGRPHAPALIVRYEVQASTGSSGRSSGVDDGSGSGAFATPAPTPAGLALSARGGAAPSPPPPPPSAADAAAPASPEVAAFVSAEIALPPRALRELQPPAIAARLRPVGPARVGEGVRFSWSLEALQWGRHGRPPPPLRWAADGPRASWLCLSPAEGAVEWAPDGSTSEGAARSHASRQSDSSCMCLLCRRNKNGSAQLNTFLAHLASPSPLRFSLGQPRPAPAGAHPRAGAHAPAGAGC